MTLEQEKKRLAELISQSINVNEDELVKLFWRIIIDGMPIGSKDEFIEINSRMERAGMSIEFKPVIDISVIPKIMRSSASDKVN